MKRLGCASFFSAVFGHASRDAVMCDMRYDAEDDFQELGTHTEGFSGSDVSVLVKDVLMQPIRLLRESTHFKQAQGRSGGAVSVCWW